MKFSYNLLEEPWIPCIDKENHPVHLSIVETVTQAHLIREIRADLPVITGSLILFLIAYVTNILKPASDQEWEKLWIRGSFPPDEIEHYNQVWRTRFDLFDKEHPFYQDPKLGARPKDKKNLGEGKQPEPKVVSGLVLHLAAGTNATLFDHSFDDLPQVYSRVEVAQLLPMLQAFSLGGMSSASMGHDKNFKDSTFGRGITILNRGQNLFESILLNTLPKSFDSLSNLEDKPAWEREDPFEIERYQPDGLLDLLTWQSRRILLLPEAFDDEIQIRFLFSAPGNAIVKTFANPFFRNQRVTNGFKQPLKLLRFQKERALWRDSTAILGTKETFSENPLPVKWAAHLQGDRILQKQFMQLDLFGMCTQPGQKKAYFYGHETFTVPAAYLNNHALFEELEFGLALAEQVRSNLYLATRELARFIVVPMHDVESVRVPGREDTDPLIRHWNAEYQYWSLLEPAFYDYLVNLPVSDDAHDEWEKAIRQSARAALRYAAEQVGTGPAGLKARAKAEQLLEHKFYQTFNPDRKE